MLFSCVPIPVLRPVVIEASALIVAQHEDSSMHVMSKCSHMLIIKHSPAKHGDVKS